MKRFSYLLIIVWMSLTASAVSNQGSMRVDNLKFHRLDGTLLVSADFVLDSLDLPSNRQFYLTPVVTDGAGAAVVELPSVLVNGRNMHYAWLRGTLADSGNHTDLYKEVRRLNGTPQSVAYTASTPILPWMMDDAASIAVMVDTCGCGNAYGRAMLPPLPLNLNPAPRMRLTYITPEVTELPVTIHEGKARVQFEVDRTELHAVPYRCRNGQQIDNRAQLKVIDDSVTYALSDPNVEIAAINVCGYASPESPYLHNEYLATNRSRALAEYLGEKYSLPADRCTYSSVPENWGEFREIVEKSPELTPAQRADLLELIDRPTYGASDFDAKERELKTSPKFASLYRSTILPKWFPLLRATKFAISTRLRPMSDEKLAEVIRTTPELMTLNQMFRVARLYPEGSPEFDNVIATALRFYPADPVANLNAAIAAIHSGDLDRAALCLSRSGNSPEAENARGVLAVHERDFDAARRHFDAAASLPEAQKNKALLD